MIRRTSNISRRDWTRHDLFALVVGHDFFLDSFEASGKFDMEAARQCWRECRDQVWAMALERNRTPWAATAFGEPEGTDE